MGAASAIAAADASVARAPATTAATRRRSVLREAIIVLGTVATPTRAHIGDVPTVAS